MTVEARERINAHRLIRQQTLPEGTPSLQSHGFVGGGRAQLLRRSVIHVVTFILSYIFTAGIGLLCIVLWVRPERPVSVVLAGVLASVVFVLFFTFIRMLTLQRLLDEGGNSEESPGINYHAGKSVAYALLALVLAGVLTGLISSAV